MSDPTGDWPKWVETAAKVVSVVAVVAAVAVTVTAVTAFTAGTGSAVTAYAGYAADLAKVDGAGGSMPSFTYGFAKEFKAFFYRIPTPTPYKWVFIFLGNITFI